MARPEIRRGFQAANGVSKDVLDRPKSSAEVPYVVHSPLQTGSWVSPCRDACRIQESMGHFHP